MRTSSTRKIGLAIAALALVVSCGDNLKASSPDGGVEPPVDAAPIHQAVSTVGGGVHSASAHFRMYGSMRGGAGASASANYRRRGAVTGAGQ